MRNILCLTILFTFFLPVNGSANESLNLEFCDAIFQPKSYSYLLRHLYAPVRLNDPALRLPKVAVNFNSFPFEPAISKPIQFQPINESGDGYFVFVRTGKTWRHNQGPSIFAIESDPTWIISALGPKLAAFLGFKLVAENRMWVPNASLFNKRITQLNKKLVGKGFEEIPVRWVDKIVASTEPEGVMRTYSENYLRSLVYQNTSPFQSGEIIHDTSHHALDIAVTPEQNAPALARYKLAIEFADFVRADPHHRSKKHFPLFSDLRRREAVLAMMFQMQARTYDNFSGSRPIMILSAEVAQGADELYSAHRVGSSHMGVEFSDLYGASITFHPERNYTLGDWLNRVVRHALPKMLELHYVGEKDGDFYALQELRKFVAKKFESEMTFIYENPNILNAELTQLLINFFKTEKSHEIILVRYSADLQVVAGLAPEELPIASMLRRIQEFQKALE